MKPITIRKDTLRGLSYNYASDLYWFCREHKIRITEPIDKKTYKYETFVIRPNTEEKWNLFKKKYSRLL